MAETSAQEGAGPGLRLLDLPTSVLNHMFCLIVGGSICNAADGVVSSGTGSGGGAVAAAAVGSPRDIVHLAFSCKAMLEAVEAAEQLWQQQCLRLGWRCGAPGRARRQHCHASTCHWRCIVVTSGQPNEPPIRPPGCSLAWLSTLPPGTSTWAYFCRRMAVRHRVRRLLRTLSRFLDPLSAAAIRPAVPAAVLAEVEAALQVCRTVGPRGCDAAHARSFPDLQQRCCALVLPSHMPNISKLHPGCPHPLPV